MHLGPHGGCSGGHSLCFLFPFYTCSLINVISNRVKKKNILGLKMQMRLEPHGDGSGGC